MLEGGALRAATSNPTTPNPCATRNPEQRYQLSGLALPRSSIRQIDWEYAAQLRDQLVERYPAAESFRPNGGWAGLYPLTPDTKFIVGPARTVEGFYNAAGGGGVGVQTSAGIGAIVADLIVHGSTQVVPHPEEYELSRFDTVSP